MTGLIRPDRPTYKSGYAPRDGQPRYPKLWDGCIGAWSMGLGITDQLQDQSGFANHGIIDAPSWTIDRYGFTLNFIDDFVNFGNLSGVGSLSRISTSLWIKPSISALTFGHIVSKFTSNSSRYGIGESSNSGRVISYVSNGIDAHGTTVEQLLVDGQWLHCVSVFDGTLSANNDRLKIYVDATDQALTYVGTFPATFSNAAPLLLGSQTVSGFHWQGLLDDVRIYNRALDPDEIATLAIRPNIAYDRLLQIPVGEPFAAAGFKPAWAGPSTHTVIA